MFPTPRSGGTTTLLLDEQQMRSKPPPQGALCVLPTLSPPLTQPLLLGSRRSEDGAREACAWPAPLPQRQGPGGARGRTGHPYSLPMF